MRANGFSGLRSLSHTVFLRDQVHQNSLLSFRLVEGTMVFRGFKDQFLLRLLACHSWTQWDRIQDLRSPEIL